MLLGFAIVLVCALAPTRADILSSHDVETVCAGQEIELTKFSELAHLVKLVDRTPCWGYIRNALVDLAATIELGRDDICAPRAFEALREYHAKYLEVPEGKRKEGERIGPLRKFAVAYGLQMSDACRWEMARVLTRETRGHLLTERDFELVDKFITDEGPVARVLGALVAPDELLMPGNLVSLIRSTWEQGDRLFLQVDVETRAQDLQAVCQLRLKPIYGPLMAPLVGLARLGIAYREKIVKSNFRDPAAIARVNQWSRIVFLCEALEGIRIVDAQQQVAARTGLPEKPIKVLTEEEAVAAEGPGVAEDSEEFEADATFVRQPVPLRDLVFDKQDKDLVRSMGAFDRWERGETASQGGAEGKRKLKKLSMAEVVRQLQDAQTGLYLSEPYRLLMRKFKRGQARSSTERLAKRLRKRLGRKINHTRDRALFAHHQPRDSADLTPLVVSLAVAKAII